MITKGYKKTEYIAAVVCLRFKAVYRTVYEKDGKFYVFYKNDVIPVSKDRMIHKSNAKE